MRSSEIPRAARWVLGRALHHLRRRRFGLVLVVGLRRSSSAEVARDLGLRALRAEDLNPWPALLRAASHDNERLVWTEVPTERPDGFWASWNGGRENLRDAELRLVVALDDAAFVELSHRASDLWSYRDRVVWLPDWSNEVGPDDLRFEGTPEILESVVERDLRQVEWPWSSPAARMEKLFRAALRLTELGRLAEAVDTMARAEALRKDVDADATLEHVELHGLSAAEALDQLFDYYAMPIAVNVGHWEQVFAQAVSREGVPTEIRVVNPSYVYVPALGSMSDVLGFRESYQGALAARERHVEFSSGVHVHFANALSTDPGPALVNLASKLIDLGDLEAAEDALHRARDAIERSRNDWRWMVASFVHQHEAAIGRLRLDVETVLAAEQRSENCRAELGAAHKRDDARARRASDLTEIGAEAPAFALLEAFPRLLPGWAGGLADYHERVVGAWLRLAEEEADHSVEDADRFQRADRLETFANVVEAASQVFSDDRRSARVFALYDEALTAAEAAEQSDRAAFLHWARARWQARTDPEAATEGFEAARRFAEGRWGPSLRARLEWERARGWREHSQLDKADAHLTAAHAALVEAPPRFRPKKATRSLALETSDLRVAQGQPEAALESLEHARAEMVDAGIDRYVLDLDLAIAELPNVSTARRRSAAHEALRAAERGQVANALARALASLVVLDPTGPAKRLHEAEQLASPLARGPVREALDRAQAAYEIASGEHMPS